MKPRFTRQLHAELRQAGENPSITPVQVRVPHQARVQHPSQNPRQRRADREPSPSERHPERVTHVRHVPLRPAPDVVPLLGVVLRQGPHQIVGEEDRVVVAEHEPPHAGGVEAGDGFLDDAGDSDGCGTRR